MFAFMNHSSYLCINIMSQMMERNLTPRMSSAVLRPPYESSRFCFVMEEEIWKAVDGYEGRYEVSSLGNVKSLARERWNGRGMARLSERILKKQFDGHGYYQVGLCDGKSVKIAKIAILVAKAFIPNLDKKPCVDHINGNRADNRVENLRWCTYKENNNFQLYKEHSSESRKGKIGEKSNRSIPVVRLDEDGSFMASYAGLSEAERKTGIDHRVISEACRGKKKFAGSYKWKYLSDYEQEEK